MSDCHLRYLNSIDNLTPAQDLGEECNGPRSRMLCCPRCGPCGRPEHRDSDEAGLWAVLTESGAWTNCRVEQP